MCLAAVVLGSCVVGPTDEGSTTDRRPRQIERIRNDAATLAPGGRWIATATLPTVAVFADPVNPVPTHQLAHPDANGTPLVLLVEARDASGEWLPVSVPVRPNGTRGWVRAGDVVLTQTQYRIKVDLAARTLTVHEGRELEVTTPVGVGKESTPTPPGQYYVKELIQPPNPDTVYGPYVFGLSGFSDVVMSLNGEGEGRIGLHGNDDPSSIGKNVS